MDKIFFKLGTYKTSWRVKILLESKWRETKPYPFMGYVELSLRMIHICLPLNHIREYFFVTNKVPWSITINQSTITRICRRWTRKRRNKKVLWLSVSYIIIIPPVPWGTIVSFVSRRSFSSFIIKFVGMIVEVEFWCSFVFWIVTSIMAMLATIVALDFW